MVNPQPKQYANVRDGDPYDVDRRDLDRVPLQCNALVRFAEYLTFRDQLRNISADAVQVIWDPRYALLIHPGGGRVVAGPRSLDRYLGRTA
jgi:hypothetical protein